MNDSFGARCSACAFVNPPGMHFCGRCGSALVTACPSCRFENPAGFSYCGSCGALLETATSGASDEEISYAAPSEPGPPPAERRQLTVLFCDLVGSTALADRLDPEDLRSVLRSYQATVTEIVERHRGHVAQLLGDGLLVYFGYPAAHEHDPHEAVRSALEIVTAVAALEAPALEALGRCRLEVRIGIHTGPVVVGEVGSGERSETLALGPTPHLAARLQAVARPGQVLLSAATGELVHGFFRTEAFADQDGSGTLLDGPGEPVAAYVALAETGLHDRFELAQSRGLTPLIGREEELALLERRLERCRRFQGQVVLISGEAGVGKSRLMAELRGRVDQQVDAWLTIRCSPQLQATPLAPVIELLRQAFGLDPADPPDALRAKLERALSRPGTDTGNAVRILAPLLSISDVERPATIGRRELRDATFDLLLELLAAASRGGSLVLAIEDLHWVDPSTLELVDRLIVSAPKLPVLLLLTMRPEFRTPWTASPHLAAIGLEPLDAEQSASLARAVAGTRALPESLVRAIGERTDGVPLFVEELTRTVVATHVEHAATDPSQIPATLRDSLTARLDALEAAKATAQLASVLGRRFTYGLLAMLSDRTETELDGDLALLVDSGLVYQRGRDRNASFTFKHALVQEAAYESILRRQRARLHEQIATHLAARLDADGMHAAVENWELLAHHREAAGQTEHAIRARLAAGSQALDRLAFREATAHLERGLGLVASLPRGPERDQLQLELLIALGSTQIVLHGYAAPQVERTYSRARRLCARNAEPPLAVLRGLHVFDFIRGDRESTALHEGRMLEVLEHVDNDFDRSLCCGAIGGRALQAGQFERAHRFLEQSIAAYDPQMHRDMMSGYGDDPGLMAVAYRPLSHYMVGRLDRVGPLTEESIAIAKPLGAWALAMVLVYAQAMARIRRRPDAVLRLARQAMEICDTERLPYWHSLARIGFGWARVKSGEPEGLDDLRDGFATWEGTGARLPRATHLGIVADVLTDLGRPDEALELVEEGIAWSDASLESSSDSWLRALKATLLLRLGTDPGEAKPWFEAAIDVAREQCSITLELLSSSMYARYLHGAGDLDRAIELMRSACAKFPRDLDEPEIAWGRRLLGRLLSIAPAKSNVGRSAS